MNFAGKTYYVAGYHRLVYCHEQLHGSLIFGAMSEFMNDAKSNVIRQQISIDDFNKLKKTEVDVFNPAVHPFMERSRNIKKWRVKDKPQRTGHFIDCAISLPDAPRTAPMFSGL